MTATTRKPARNPKPLAKETPMPKNIPVEVEDAAPTRAYSVSVGRDRLGVFATFKEARAAAWREAKRRGGDVPPTPKLFFATALRGAGAWEVKVGRMKFVVKEFILTEAEEAA